MTKDAGGKTIYDEIGSGYSANRMADPRWEQAIHNALGAAQTILNVGAGGGSYEPERLSVVALEPSRNMIRQRQQASPPVVQGVAENQPFRDGAFEAAMAVLTTHHWTDPVRGLDELCRVSRKQVVVTWDPDWFATRFWLIRDYLPEIGELERGLATVNVVTDYFERRGAGCRVEPLLVPADCTDGFFGGYWKRPQAYLDANIRASMSGLALLDAAVVGSAMERLEADLSRGVWQRRYPELAGLSEADLGYRIVVADS